MANKLAKIALLAAAFGAAYLAFRSTMANGVAPAQSALVPQSGLIDFSFLNGLFPSGVPASVAQPAQNATSNFGSLFDYEMSSGDLGGGAWPQAVAAVSHDVDTLARTIWGEARSESLSGREAVANVVMNRVRSSRYPSGVAAVCKQDMQFSAWNSNDPNLPRMLAVTNSDGVFRDCLAIAQSAVNGTLGDRTGGALHYYAKYIEPPYWVGNAQVSARIGQHIFLTGVA